MWQGQGHSHFDKATNGHGKGVSAAAMETPMLKGSWRLHPMWSESLKGGQETTGEDITLVAVETTVCCRFPSCGVTTKSNSRCGVELPEPAGQSVCATMAEPQKWDFPSSLEPRRQ